MCWDISKKVSPIPSAYIELTDSGMGSSGDPSVQLGGFVSVTCCRFLPCDMNMCNAFSVLEGIHHWTGEHAHGRVLLPTRFRAIRQGMGPN